MNEKKPSFKELLRDLYQAEWVLYIFILYFFTCFFIMLINFFFIFLPYIFIPDYNNPNDIFMYMMLTIFSLAIGLIPSIQYNRRDKRAVFFTNSVIEEIIENVSDMNLFQNENEKTILKKNFKSLYIFQKINEYKYSIIVMGSIIEFLLIRYCHKNKFEPEPYSTSNGDTIPASRKRFCNYIQSAIKNDILGQKNSWYIIQNNLRNFRNYVHISKEIKEETIDQDWFIATKGVFDRIIRNFKPRSKPT